MPNFQTIYGGVRGNDAEGSGYYGASRAGGARVHRGIDLIIPTHKSIILYAPISGKLTPGLPYISGPKLTKSGVNVNQGYTISGLKGTDYDGLIAQVFYCVAKIKFGSLVEIGDPVGITIPDMYSAYNKIEGKNGMTNHVHYQLRFNGQFIDPSLVNTADFNTYKLAVDPVSPLYEYELENILKKFPIATPGISPLPPPIPPQFIDPTSQIRSTPNFLVNPNL